MIQTSFSERGTMTYMTRDGQLLGSEDSQDRLTTFLYNSRIGNLALKVLTLPCLTKLAGAFLSTPLSALLIDSFIKKNGISLEDCEPKKYTSFNDFFTRELKPEARLIDFDPNHLISPCDSKLTVIPIGEDSVFDIKNVSYSLTSLLRDKKLAKRYLGGTALLFRLGVTDYHRYCYPDNAKKSRNRYLPGVFHTVNPIAAEARHIYAENSRELTLLRTENFGDILQMEVGAMLVGKIHNHHGIDKVYRGQEKGYFMFGGSTVILLLEKGRFEADEDILCNSLAGYETEVKYGEKIGYKPVTN